MKTSKRETQIYEDSDIQDFTDPDTYSITRLLKPIGIGFLIFLFLLFVSCVPVMLENAKTTEEQETAIYIGCLFGLVVCFFVVVRMINRI